MQLPKGSWAGDNEWLTTCFSCGREKFYFNVQKKTGHCQRCKINVGSYKQLVKRHTNLVEIGVFSKDTGTTVDTLPNNAYPASLNVEAVRFLRTRYLTQDNLVEEEVMYASGTLYFPLTPLSPELPRVWIKRSLSNGNWYVPKGENKKPYVYISNKYKGVSSPSSMVVVEGVLDCIPDRYGIPTLSILGTNISKELVTYIRALKIPHLFVHLDNDKPGEKGYRVLKRALRHTCTSVQRILTDEDPGSYAVTDTIIESIREIINEKY